MGNLNNKTSLHTNHKQAVHSVRDGQTFTSQVIFCDIKLANVILS